MKKIAIGSYNIMKLTNTQLNSSTKKQNNTEATRPTNRGHRKSDASKWIYAVAFGLIAAFSAPGEARAQVKTDPKKVMGANECAECHKETAQIWQNTHHFTTFRKMPRSKEAKAISKKMKIKRIKSSKLCSSCHFTLQQNDKKKPKPISGISCEKCHGAGKEYIKLHSGYSGNKNKKDETKAQAKKRWKDAAAKGMIRPSKLYSLAKNCYSCHVVPQEKLVNVGGHPAGSKFDLVAWSQGEVRHNLWYTKGKNLKATAKRKRMLYLVGLAVEYETALRAVGKSTKKKKYAVSMARRAAAARKKITTASKLLPKVKQLKAIVKIGKTAALKLNNNKKLTVAANKIAKQTLSLVAKHTGSKFGAIDKLIPGEDKYKGTPAL